MQLFICPQYEVKNSELCINADSELINQFKRVLRVRPGYEFFLQGENAEKRYKLRFKSLVDNTIFSDILEEIVVPNNIKRTGMAIALPNRFDKLELIVQKLVEIGITDIYFWVAERSLLKELSENKWKRLKKIVKEAVEQSWGWQLPHLELISSFEYLRDRNFVIFDLHNGETGKNGLSEKTFLGVIGPEGGLTPQDYEKFPKIFDIVSLGDNVLRMETAAIVGAWYIKNILRI